MARAETTRTQTRIQREKTDAILQAALQIFAQHGYRGSTIDQIAAEAGLSKPNLLYYFDGKQSIHADLLRRLLTRWLEPLQTLRADGDPIDEICDYVARKLEMSRKYPVESRLFANEIIQGAPRILEDLKGPLKQLVDEKAEVISGWARAGRIADVDPYHLIFSIWATTQHYADFDVQVMSILGTDDEERFSNAGTFLDHMFRRLLKPGE